MSRVEQHRRRAAGRGKGQQTSRRRASPVLHWTGLLQGRVLMLFGLLCVLLLSGLSVVRVTHQNRFVFNALQERRDEAVALNVAWGQLLLEQSTFGVEGRIEQKAVEQLQMEVPDLSDIVMVNHD